MQVQQMEHQGKTQEEMDLAIANRDLKKKAELRKLEIKKLEERLKLEHSTVLEMKKLKDQQVVLTLKLNEIEAAKDAGQSDEALQKRMRTLLQ